LVAEEHLTGSKHVCLLADGSKVEAPIFRLSIDTPYYISEVEVWCLINPFFDLIIGHIPNVRDLVDPDSNWKPGIIQTVTTCQQVQRDRRRDEFLRLPDIIGPALDISLLDLVKSQDDDEMLRKIRTLACEPVDDSVAARFLRKRGMLYRSFQSPKDDNKQLTQLVVPKPLRNRVMSLAHDSLMSGHLETKRTRDKVLSEFYWSGVQSDVRRFCRLCDICQRTTPIGRTTKVPLCQMPIIDVPFQRVAVDLVGPI
jgi:hypothetical protein